MAILFGFGFVGASATELRRRACIEFGEEALDRNSLLQREREAFTALEVAIYELLADPGVEETRTGLSHLDKYLTQVRQSLSRPGPAVVLPAVDRIFVNRESEIAALEEATAGSAGSVSYLVGMGGSGKSASAIQFADRFSYRFLDLVIHVDLPSAGVEGALLQVGLALGVGDAMTSEASGEEKAALLRALLTNRRVLIILDDVDGKASLDRHLRAFQPADVVITTRYRSLAGTRDPIVVHELGRDASLELLRAILGGGRIEGEDMAANRIADLLGDLPLALRIYGSRIAASQDMLSTHVARLTTYPVTPQLKLTAVGQQSKDSSVPASIALSFEDLTDSGLRMIRALGLVRGGEFTPTCARAVTRMGEQAAARALELLYERCLIQQASKGRWRLHPLVDDFVRIVYPADEQHHQNLVSFAIATAERARKLARTPREADSFDGLERDTAALEQALASVRNGHDFDSEAHILAGIARVSASRGTGVHLYGRLKELTLVPLSSPALLILLEAATWVAGELSEFKEGLALGQRWFEEAVRQRQDDQAAAALGRLASHAWCIGRYEEALGYLRRARLRWQRLGDPSGLATAVNLRGLVRCYQGHYAEAAVDFTDAMTRWHDQGDEARHAMAQHNLAEAERCRGHLELARSLYEKSLDVRLQLKSSWDVVNSLNCLGEVARATNEFDAADLYFSSALDLAFPMWNKVAIATAVAGRATLRIESDPIQAARLLGSAEALLRQSASRLGPANNLEYHRLRMVCSGIVGRAAFAGLMREGAALTLIQIYEHSKLIPAL